MNYRLTNEQLLLRDALVQYLRDHAVASATAAMTPHWSAFANQLGILGATFPEHLGGAGGGILEAAVIMEELGRALVPEPFLETVVICGAVLVACASVETRRVIREVIAGDAIIGLAHSEPHSRYDLACVETTAVEVEGGFRLSGRKVVVLHAPVSRYLLVSARTNGSNREESGISVFLLETSAPGIARRDYLTVDARSASDIELENVFVADSRLLGAAGEGLKVLRPAIDAGIVAVCAEAVGCLRAMLEATVSYARQRHQFGKPLSSFQVLRHAMVDMFLATEQAAAITHRAALSESGTADRQRIVSAAKVQVAKACRLVGQHAIQIHGAIGTTEELPLSGYFKRSTMIESQFGSVDHHLDRYAASTREV